EGVADQLALEKPGGRQAPAVAFSEPREGAAGHQLPGRLRDDVVVGRRAPAPEGREVLLMPADLANHELVVLEMIGDFGPFVQQAPDPGQADQADADLDAA